MLLPPVVSFLAVANEVVTTPNATTVSFVVTLVAFNWVVVAPVASDTNEVDVIPEFAVVTDFVAAYFDCDVTDVVILL